MSDMLQLVVEMGHTQAGYYPFRRTLSVAQMSDVLQLVVEMGHTQA
jgi:hypothetical protein